MASKLLIIIVIAVSAVVFFSTCISSKPGEDPRGKQYAGAETCRQCHQAIHDSFAITSHYNTTARASTQTLMGNFNPPANEFAYDSITKVVMEKRDSNFYQVLYNNGREEKAYQFDIVFGRKHAQTSLYIQGGKFYELPVSYYHTKKGWASSPGYPHDKPLFTRLVDTECLDCHSSNASIDANTAITSEPIINLQSILLGIDCERCHGPAKKHVDFHLSHPETKGGAFLVNTKKLNRQQHLDACAICHSGNDKSKIQSRFEFQIGDTMGYFFMPFGNSKKEPDVHGNQYGLLTLSKCFKLSQMTCGTCHDPHKNASSNLSIYSNTCMGCHDPGKDKFCPEYATFGEKIKNNCIDCHMPKQSSQAISFRMQQASAASPYLLRTHQIAVYKDSALAHARKLLSGY